MPLPVVFIPLSSDTRAKSVGFSFVTSPGLKVTSFIKLRGKELAISSLGASAGFILGEFLTEFIVRTFGIEEIEKITALKVLGKSILAVIVGTASVAMLGPLGMFMTTMAYGLGGSALVDIFRLVVPGGEQGAAETAASAVRKAMGMEMIESMTQQVTFKKVGGEEQRKVRVKAAPSRREETTPGLLAVHQ